jgi:hypothetical protein
MWQRIWVFAGEAICGTKGSGSSKDQALVQDQNSLQN